MNRFRKKSDAHRGQFSANSPTFNGEPSQSKTDALPELSLTNDFRTSLILPDLSRRFSVLRSSTSDPLAFDHHLRSRFADQRAQGVENHITEEEEDMLLDALGRIRIRHNTTSTPERSQENVSVTAVEGNIGGGASGENGVRNSIQSGTSSITSTTSSPGRSAKRYSNNLFGSGRLRDYSYLKSVSSSKSSASSTRTVSVAPTEASVRNMSTSSLRPVTPEGTVTPSGSVTSSPNAYPTASENGSLRSTSLSPPVEGPLESISEVELGLEQRLGSSNLKRASLALEQAIKEIEDEVEEEILLPRTTPIPRGSLDQPTAEVRNSHVSNHSSVFEGGMAISIDKTIHDEFHERRASPTPSRAVPGYVPGMPRPMTPRDFEFDEQIRSHSTTPRAQSPYSIDPMANSNPATTIPSTTKLRRDSTSSITKPMPAAPLFLQRSTNGRFTPTASSTASSGEESHQRSASVDHTVEFDSPLNSSLLSRRRPASPLASPPYQPMAVGSRPNSRPSTPSNVIWTPNSNGNGHGHRHGHSRSGSGSGSWTADGSIGSDYSPSTNKPSRTLRSNAVSDSPTYEGLPTSPLSFGSAGNSAKENSSSPSTSPSSGGRHQPYSPDTEYGSPTITSSNPLPRAITPTQFAQRSPISPAFSNFDLTTRNGTKRTSRQNPPPQSSPFNISAFPGLGLSARANSSRDSVDSVGSSFHSWDEPDRVFNVFSDPKDQQLAWHEFGDQDKASTTTNGDDSDDWDAEEVLKRYGGLKQTDIVAIQEKLVTAAFVKIATTDPRDRAPSALRRRRPSTSQSNYTRVASPPPQVQPPASPTYPPADDQFSKASALLNSVVESIKDQPPSPDAASSTAPTFLDTNTISQSHSTSSDDISPSTRRNRALARVLFGEEDATDEDLLESGKDDTIKFIPEPPLVLQTPTISTTPIIPQATSSTSTGSGSTPLTATPATTLPSSLSSISPSSSQPQPVADDTPAEPLYSFQGNPSTIKVPPTQDQAELTREVQKKAEAAMLALNKNSSKVELSQGLNYSPSIRKRLETKNIGSPTLVSTTNNLDTLPMTSVNNSSGNTGLGARFKRLRGSLRVKNSVPVEEHPVQLQRELKSPQASQVTHYDSVKLHPIGNVPSAPPSASPDSGRFKVPIQSPPSSAGPGLKGFMARFRNKQRMSTEPTATAEVSIPPPPPPVSTVPAPPPAPIVPLAPLSPRSPEATTPKPPPSPRQRPMYSRFPPANPSSSQSVNSQSMESPTTPLPSAQSDLTTPLAPGFPSTTEPNEASRNTTPSASALQQLFRAAEDLGLDQNALNDLLARSGSTTSRNPPRRSNTVTASSSGSKPGATSNEAPQMGYVSSSGSDQTTTAADYASGSNQPQTKPDFRPVTPDEAGLSRKTSTRKTDHLRKPKEGQLENPTSAVVRRTIIYANDTADFAAVMQKKNAARRKRASTTSVSSRSVQDRAPTPPPPKAPAVKRFSADGLPPMPQLPHFLGQPNHLNVPGPNGNEKSYSTHESLYDMYAGESRAVSVAVGDESQMPSDVAPALEVIELANGETVWNVVNGLRDTDEASVYSRTSFTSDFSNREDVSPGQAKGHNRSESKGSVASSFISSSKKKGGQQGKLRPETKVFYSTSEQIGRLIESLSQGAEAGSFNFLPSPPSNRPGHSASSSLSTNDINWTVEERLERMLGAMGAS
ncbi:hypothetical protein CPB83DRAFT_474243 [Crepidotus variabilis]|uniref:Uncharacterized protein n=1 Tax=Crepidotus variabilis TaxID=179855 RepID=A0A9P6EP98_9AGAR|nr:hypothetical protein CPB83DRAFT_474243 [Crepidotus variabilis]